MLGLERANSPPPDRCPFEQVRGNCRSPPVTSVYPKSAGCDVVSKHTRCASVVATTEVKVLALDWLQIRAIARTCPYSTSLLFFNLTRLVSERYSLHIAKGPGYRSVLLGANLSLGSVEEVFGAARLKPHWHIHPVWQYHQHVYIPIDR